MPKLAIELTKQLQIEAKKGKDFTVEALRALSAIIESPHPATTFNGWRKVRNIPTTLEA